MKNARKLLAENAKDMAGGRDKGLTGALMDRLELNDARIEAMAQGLEDVAALDDPVGSVMAAWDRPNGPPYRARAYASGCHRRDI